MYVATINVPGYLPMDDDPPTFDTAKEAWDYLAGERDNELDQAAAAADIDDEWAGMADECYTALHDHADESGTVYGSTPGYDGDHDLGLAYCVTEVEA